jgi:Ca2+/Na+ antiporter
VVETRLLSLWDGLVGSAALIAIIILALCVMVSAVKLGDALRRLGVIVGVVILLIMLPAIILSLWNSMTLWQHLGIAAICIAIIFLISALRRKSVKARR